MPYRKTGQTRSPRFKIRQDLSGGRRHQDYKSREIDSVIELDDGRWCAFEIRLGANQIDAAASELVSIRDSIAEENNSNPPSVLCVICGMSNAAYKRPDGVYVVPITALKA